MEFRELIYKRRSNRQLTGGKIPACDIRLMLDAGVRAPNACNYQSWHFYCITDKEKIEGIVPDICTQAWIKNASVVFVITEDNRRLEERWGKEKADLFVAQDSGAATENILLMAANLGYAGCFVGAFDEGKCREYIGAGENERPVSMIPVGTYEVEPLLRERKLYEETITFIGDPCTDGGDEPERRPFELIAGYYGDSIFHDVNLQRARFNDVTLKRAEFNNVNMSGVRFTDINMTNAFFGGMCMNGSYFGCVDMKEATFENPDLTGTEFKNCTFRDVKLENCNIEGMTINGISVKELLDKAK